ncbi:MAG: DUF4189 domain-containing protein [Bdellovibrionales bacterium]
MHPTRKKYILRIGFLVLAVVAVAAYARHAQPTHAQCVKACLHARDCDLDFSRPHVLNPTCLIDQNQCFAQCRGDKAQPQKPKIHGAIAHDMESGAWGVADVSPSPEIAKDSALGFCRRFGKKCAIKDTFSKTCVAVATGGDRAVVWITDIDREAAKKKALAGCEARARAACAVKLSNCYFPEKK